MTGQKIEILIPHVYHLRLLRLSYVSRKDMDIETQQAMTSRNFLAAYPREWAKASKCSQSERSRLADDYIKHKVRYNMYMSTREDATFWIPRLPLTKEERQREKQRKKEEEEARIAEEQGLELPKRVATDIYLIDDVVDTVDQVEFDLGDG
jgi:hypothetical protein